MNLMYKVYLFDFGNVFLNLDINSTKNELVKFGLKEFTPEMIAQNHLYEKGLISTDLFLEFYQRIFPKATKKELKAAWNKILLNFPLERLLFIEKFSKDHTCMLLSNINDMHLEYIKNNLGESFYNRFTNCFNKIYYSHFIHKRKPDKEIYNYVLQENDLKAGEVFFIDDIKENTTVAKEIGFDIWNIKPNFEDIINLNEQLKR